MEHLNPNQHIPHNRGLRHEAKLRGEVHYFTGKECKNGHIEKRLVSSGGCMECARLQTAKTRLKETIQQRALRLQKSVERAAQWRLNNPDHENTKIVKRRYALVHKESKNAKSREYSKKYPEKKALAGRNWRKNNPFKNAAKTAKRNAAKLQRTPLWLTQEHHKQIGQFYWEAAEVSKLVGEFYHVDHIVPLQGKTVSGLHVPWNLQILHAQENLSKGNNHG